MMLRRLAGYGPAFVLTVVILLLWELSVRIGTISDFYLPAPTAILSALFANWNVIFGHTIQTLLETVLGLAIATVLGLVLAILLDITPWVRKAIYPILITSQTIPMIALAPLLIVWFGLGLGPKVIVVTLYCFFPITVACADGLFAVDPDLVRLMRSMDASRWQILSLVQLPGAMPAFFSGLRLAATYSMTAAIFGEFVAAEQGLGVYMKLSFNARVIVLVFAGIVVTALLSLLLFGFVTLIERIALPWHRGAKRQV